MDAGPFDWRSALAFALVVVFGLLYARMVIVERLPMIAVWFPK